MKTEVAPTLSFKRKVAFYTIMLLIPVFILLMLEGGLRLVGFGKDSPLFIENPAHPDYLLGRPDVMNRYFPFAKVKPNVTLETDFFLKEKPENGIRVFVQGGSTAAGFPYGLGASLAGFLEYRLKESLPNNHVEVINTAMSAVNSHTLLDFADEIIEQQPDLIVIYAGHNEFLGVLGASSNFATSDSYWLTRTMIRIRDWRLFQLFQWLYAAFQAEPDNANIISVKQDNTMGRSMMAKVAADQNIEFDSPVYRASIKQFDKNMSSLLSKYQSAGIPVVISSIASNHKDQAPLKSKDIAANRMQLLAALRQNNSLEKSEVNKASKSIIHETSADLHFEFANIALKQNVRDIAEKHFALAVKHDLLKFRAPELINEKIRSLASRYDAHFADAKARLKNRSPSKIVGNESMLEHLHPNLQGYFVISDAIYQSIQENKLNSIWNTSWTNMPAQKAWNDRLILPSEEYNGFAIIQNLKSDFPFVDSPQKIKLPKPTSYPLELGLQHFQKQLDWQGMMEKNLAYYRNQNDKVMVSKTLQILADAVPHNGMYNIQAAEALDKLQRPHQAVYYYKRAIKAGLVDTSVETRINEILSK
jgi:lysophospholipase L1-like esterase